MFWKLLVIHRNGLHDCVCVKKNRSTSSHHFATRRAVAMYICFFITWHWHSIQTQLLTWKQHTWIIGQWLLYMVLVIGLNALEKFWKIIGKNVWEPCSYVHHHKCLIVNKDWNVFVFYMYVYFKWASTGPLGPILVQMWSLWTSSTSNSSLFSPYLFQLALCIPVIPVFRRWHHFYPVHFPLISFGSA